MEENNRKGPGVFYAVVGVATLVVAIIGATFAYFSASISNDANNDAVEGTTANGSSFVLAIDKVTESASGKLVPLDTATPWLATSGETSQMPDALEAGCIDEVGNTVCQVYEITLTGSNIDASTTLRALGNLDVTVNKTTVDATNLKWKLIPAATSDGETTVHSDVATEVAGTPGTYAHHITGLLTASNGDTFTADDSSTTDVTENERVYYVVLWLEETGAPQDTPDASVSYTGTVTFNIVDNTGANLSGLTATFNTTE